MLLYRVDIKVDGAWGIEENLEELDAGLSNLGENLWTNLC